MEWTGKMEVSDYADGDLYFQLDSKEFVGCEGPVVQTLCNLVDRKITLVTNNDSPFANNDDHCFIEEIKHIGPDRFEIWLGS
jgi:hypothetical protein